MNKKEAEFFAKEIIKQNKEAKWHCYFEYPYNLFYIECKIPIKNPSAFFAKNYSSKYISLYVYSNHSFIINLETKNIKATCKKFGIDYKKISFNKLIKNKKDKEIMIKLINNCLKDMLIEFE